MKDKVKIMIVDDDEILAREIKENLLEIGYEVLETVSSGEQAIIQAEEQRPDLILMDIILSGKIDGLEAAKEIFSRLDIPIVYITALGDEKTLQRAKVTEPYGYIMKPFRVEDLRITIEIAIYKYRMGKKLRESEKDLRLFSQAAESSPDGVAMGNFEGRITYVNKTFVRMFGYSKEELIGKGIASIYSKDQIPKLEEALKATIEGGWTGELVGKRKNGELFPMAISSTVVMDEKGRVVAHMASHRDITERIKAEKAVQESEEKLNTLLNATTDVAFLTEPDGTFLEINDALAKSLGRKKAELVGKSMFEFFSVEVAERRMTILQKIVESKKSYHGEDERAGKYFENSAYPILDEYGKVKQIAVFAKDITERKRDEEALKASSLATETSMSAIFIADIKGMITYANTSAAKMWGYKNTKEMIGTNVVEYWTKSTQGRVRKMIEKLLKKGCVVTSGELFGKRLDGTEFIVESNSVIIKDEKGKPVGMIGSFSDITKRNKAEKALQESEEKYRKLINTSIEGIISTDSQMKIILWNPGAEKIFGYTGKEMLGQYLSKIIPESYRKEINKGFIEFRKTGLGPVIGKTLELEGLGKDGSEIPVELSVSSRNAGGNNIATAIVRDITARKEMEHRLLHSERLAGICELAAGIAHEIRNPLGNISFAAQLCLSKNKIDKQTKQYLNIVLTESENANIIIKKLLDFANPRDISLKLENIHNVIDNAINLVSIRLLASDIRIIKKYSKKLPGILLDERWIEQCFGNFLLNAIEAMPDGGAIIISTQLDLENNEIIVVVLDKGIGIPKKNLERIFNPFFTTKEEGVGLGLSLVHQIIQSHNGKINLESQIGKGTKVIITFPIKEKNII